ncbi:MAG: SOS response-associated peptidase family protein [Cyclobacteriaceae bacterium]
MCYDAETSLKRQLREAENLGADKDEIDAIRRKMALIERQKRNEDFPTSEYVFDEKDLPDYYHISGFAHPNLSFITSINPTKTDFGIWGFIPRWVKSKAEAYDYKKPYNSNLNAKSEGIFESRAFKYAARYKRCAIMLDAYYEHHHQNKKTYPFRIYHQENKPLWVAGIYEQNEWNDESTGEIESFNSFAILTCRANETLAKIHNNPKMIARAGHRMLVILDEDQLEKFLAPYPNNQDKKEDELFETEILNICQPYDDDLLGYHTVKNLKPRKDHPYIGNVPEIKEPYIWPDLDTRTIIG